MVLHGLVARRHWIRREWLSTGKGLDYLSRGDVKAAGADGRHRVWTGEGEPIRRAAVCGRLQSRAGGGREGV